MCWFMAKELFIPYTIESEEKFSWLYEHKAKSYLILQSRNNISGRVYQFEDEELYMEFMLIYG